MSRQVSRSSLLTDRSGNVIMIFAISAFALIGLVGGAVDMSRVDSARRNLQDAADAAVLRTMPMGSASDADRVKAADQAFQDNLKQTDAGSITHDLIGTKVDTSTIETYKVSAVVKSYFGAFFGKSEYTVNVVSQARVDNASYEIAFVLDNTGSMAQSGKMANLKSSVDSALASLLDASGKNNSKSKVAVVPFNKQVRLDATTLSSMTSLGIVTAGAGNCMQDRNQPYDTNATAAITGNTNTLYQRVNCTYSTKETQGLSDNIATARSFIQTMAPDGNTNITIGVQWGMETLSPNQPFTGAVPFTDKSVRKVMIVVTDGDNTENRWTGNQAQIDARTAIACQSAKDLGITVYTVKVIAGSSSLLRNCASDPSKFYDLTSAAQLNAAMAGIFKSIYTPHLTL